jgi:hypothetical protein
MLNIGRTGPNAGYASICDVEGLRGGLFPWIHAAFHRSILRPNRQQRSFPTGSSLDLATPAQPFPRLPLFHPNYHSPANVLGAIRSGYTRGSYGRSGLRSPFLLDLVRILLLGSNVQGPIHGQGLCLDSILCRLTIPPYFAAFWARPHQEWALAWKIRALCRRKNHQSILANFLPQSLILDPHNACILVLRCFRCGWFLAAVFATVAIQFRPGLFTVFTRLSCGLLPPFGLRFGHRSSIFRQLGHRQNVGVQEARSLVAVHQFGENSRTLRPWPYCRHSTRAGNRSGVSH